MSAPTSTVEPSTPTAPAPGATQVHPTPNNSNSNANINGISASAATSVSSPSPAPSSSLATTPAPDATHVPAPSASSAAPTDGATPSAAAVPSTCGVCKQAINQPGFKTCVRCRVKRNAARKRRLEQRRIDTNTNGATGNGSVPGTGASTPLMGLNLEEGTEGSVASEGDVAMEHEEDVSTREGSHAHEEEEEEEMSPWDKKRTTLLAAATATLGGAAVAMAESSASAAQAAGSAALMTSNNTNSMAALAAAALDEESDGAVEDYASDVEMKDEPASRALSPPTPSPPLLPPPVPASAPVPRPPLDVARLDAEFERRDAEIKAARLAALSTPAPAPPPVASASAPPAGIDGAPCTVCKGPRDNAKYKTCAACRARSRESWRRQSAKRKALAATGGQPTPASSARPTPATSRANSPVHVPAPIPAPAPAPVAAAGATVTPIPVYVPPPPDPGAPVPGGTIISGVNVGPGGTFIPAPVLAPIPISSTPTPSVDPEKQRRLCSSCRSALAPPRYRTCEHCRWIARREAAASSGQPFTEAEPPTSRLGARRGRKRLNPAEPRVERVGKKRRVLFEVDEDEYTFEREALDVVRDVLRGGGERDVRVTWAVVAGEKGGFGRLARLERVAEAMRSKGIPISPDSEEQEPGSSPYAGPDAVTERWTCTCAQSQSPESAEDDAMDVDTHNETCGGYVYVSCSWDTHSHPAHLRGQRVTIVVVHEPNLTVEAPAMLEAPTPVIEEA